MRIKQRWNNHLKQNKMTYTQHLFFALFCALQSLIASICFATHAFLPCIYRKSGSNIVIKLAQKFKNRR